MATPLPVRAAYADGPGSCRRTPQGASCLAEGRTGASSTAPATLLASSAPSNNSFIRRQSMHINSGKARDAQSRTFSRLLVACPGGDQASSGRWDSGSGRFRKAAWSRAQQHQPRFSPKRSAPKRNYSHLSLDSTGRDAPPLRTPPGSRLQPPGIFFPGAPNSNLYRCGGEKEGGTHTGVPPWRNPPKRPPRQPNLFTKKLDETQPGRPRQHKARPGPGS